MTLVLTLRAAKIKVRKKRRVHTRKWRELCKLVIVGKEFMTLGLAACQFFK